MFDGFTISESAIWYLAAFSIVSFFGTIIAIPLLVIRIPQDYFSETKRHRWEPWAHEHPAIRWTLLILKNLLGYVFIFLGIAMLLLPGQGVLTILLGMMLINFPGKYRLERWVITRAPVLNTINTLRHRAGRTPLVT